MKKKMTPAKRFKDQVGKLRFQQYTERKSGKTIASRSEQALDHANSMAAMPRKMGVRVETIRQHKTIGGGVMPVNACVRRNDGVTFGKPAATVKAGDKDATKTIHLKITTKNKPDRFASFELVGTQSNMPMAYADACDYFINQLEKIHHKPMETFLESADFRGYTHMPVAFERGIHTYTFTYA